ncbi:MAG: FGGY-family carbohydrate kinase, partial [Bacteroidota bacterium]
MVREATGTAVVDVGKTNKKLLVFSPDFKILHEESVVIPEITDEDGFPTEDLVALTEWMKAAVHRVIADDSFDISHLNFSGYGASFVHLDADGLPVTPLYNYLKPFPEAVQKQFESDFGSMESIAIQTSSPVLGNLNSGLQVYRLMAEKPDVFNKIRWSLHLPQYLSWVFTGNPVTDLTSLGCHTMLWDLSAGHYHRWVAGAGIDRVLAPIAKSIHSVEVTIGDKNVVAGVGLHDSSAALIPYLRLNRGDFMLLSTGTWSIALNPFNDESLTADQLQNDCLCYLTPEGRPVKASRLFAGRMHDEGVSRIAAHYHCHPDFYKTVATVDAADEAGMAYVDLLRSLVEAHVAALSLVSNSQIRHLYVDGGFSNNQLFMKLLANACPQWRVFAAVVPQASAIGAALHIIGP